jgi:FkbM family methyltransferase
MKSSPKASPAPLATVQISDIKLSVLNNPNDIGWYSQRQAYEERNSRLYPLIAQYGFENFVDIGSNVGYVSVLAGKADPALSIISIEADPRLVELISENLSNNTTNAFQVIHALLGLTNDSTSSFSLNPSSTLDNRVNIKDWDQVQVPTRNMQSIASELKLGEKTFFKVDTQGYELQVIKGMHDFLVQNNGWRMKAEFAPYWLLSQGTEPIELLTYLLNNFQVAEAPERIDFNTLVLDDLWARSLTVDQAGDFIEWITNLNRDKRGWVDLLIRPKQ